MLFIRTYLLIGLFMLSNIRIAQIAENGGLGFEDEESSYDHTCDRDKKQGRQETSMYRAYHGLSTTKYSNLK